MLKIFAVALLTIPMCVGSVHAATKGHGHALPACSDGQQAKAACVCGGTDKSHPGAHCSKDQWCHGGTCSK
jgi:hypothetical protein